MAFPIKKGSSDKTKVKEIQTLFQNLKIPSIKDGAVLSAASPSNDGSFGSITEGTLFYLLGRKEVSEKLYEKIVFTNELFSGNVNTWAAAQSKSDVKIYPKIAFAYAMIQMLNYRYILVLDKIDVSGWDNQTKHPLYARYNTASNVFEQIGNSGGLFTKVTTASGIENELKSQLNINGITDKPLFYHGLKPSFFDAINFGSTVEGWFGSQPAGAKLQDMFKLAGELKNVILANSKPIQPSNDNGTGQSTGTGGDYGGGYGTGYGTGTGSGTGTGTGGSMWDGLTGGLGATMKNVGDILNIMLIFFVIKQLGSAQRSLR